MTEPARANGFDWPADRIAEFNSAWRNGRVGSILVSENDRVRVWHLSLKPGQRIGFHMHVLDYFWTAVTGGKSRSHMHDGRVVDTEYTAGSTKHYKFGRGEFMIHDLENVGDTELVFVTVEHKISDNQPLPIA
nr:hypothetical protein [Bradyrhizobium mercantei]